MNKLKYRVKEKLPWCPEYAVLHDPLSEPAATASIPVRVLAMKLIKPKVGRIQAAKRSHLIFQKKIEMAKYLKICPLFFPL